MPVVTCVPCVVGYNHLQVRAAGKVILWGGTIPWEAASGSLQEAGMFYILSQVVVTRMEHYFLNSVFLSYVLKKYVLRNKRVNPT